MYLARNLLVACLVFLMGSEFALARETRDIDEKPVSIREKTSGLVHMPGFMELYRGELEGRILLQADNMDEELIYQSSIPGPPIGDQPPPAAD